MGLTMQEKQAVTREKALKYKKARKKEKKKMLDEVVELTCYSRKYASHVLSLWGKKAVIRDKAGNEIIFVPQKKKAQRKRKPLYGPDVFRALRTLWIIGDCICGKRLKPMLQEVVPVLEKCGELHLGVRVRKKLLEISAATIDRMLQNEKKKIVGKGRSRTKPGTLLKSQIPIRRFSDWNEGKPGFMEMDLVSHEGGATAGDYAYTLNMTDIYSGWTEICAVKNKAQVWVFEALQAIRQRLPFPLLGVDSDNGSEFINDHLVRYCAAEHITFTRSRAYRKNDNCYVEQKNFSVVRRYVGYLRYDTEEELKKLNVLYQKVRLYTNFFLPVMKLKYKERIGSRVKKVYDEPKTPFRRILLCSSVEDTVKEKLKALYETLNPAALKREMSKQQNQLIRFVQFKETMRKKMPQKKNNRFVMISS